MSFGGSVIGRQVIVPRGGLVAVMREEMCSAIFWVEPRTEA